MLAPVLAPVPLMPAPAFTPTPPGPAPKPTPTPVSSARAVAAATLIVPRATAAITKAILMTYPFREWTPDEVTRHGPLRLAFDAARGLAGLMGTGWCDHPPVSDPRSPNPP